MRRIFQDLLPHFGPVWKLALPVILANSLQALVNVSGMFMAGRLGPVEIAALGMANSVTMLVIMAFMSVTAGAMTLAAQARGTRNDQELSSVARQTVSLSVIMWLVFGALGLLFSRYLLVFLNGPGDPLAVELGTAYLQIVFAGLVFMVLNFAISSLMQGAGDTVTPLYLAIGMNIINVLLNYVFIFGLGPIPAMGVPGAALGTVVSRALAAVVGIMVMQSGRNVVKLGRGSYLPDWAVFREILSIGVPSGLQGVVRNTSHLLVIRIVTATSAGTLGAGALSLGLMIESLAFMPGLAISVAATSLVGQALGAWQTSDARQRGNAAILLGLLVMGGIAVPLIVFAPQVIMLFDPSANETLLAAGTSYVRINGLALPLLAFAMIGNGALRGAGDTTPGLWGAILSRWAIVVPIAWYLALRLDMGVEGVWWALAAGTLFQAVFVSFNWLSKRWLRISLHRSRLWRFHLQGLPPERCNAFLDGVKARVLAEQGTSEHVDRDGVTYHTPEGEIRIRFEGDWLVERGAAVLESLRAGERPAEHAAPT